MPNSLIFLSTLFLYMSLSAERLPSKQLVDNQINSLDLTSQQLCRIELNYRNDSMEYSLNLSEKFKGYLKKWKNCKKPRGEVFIMLRNYYQMNSRMFPRLKSFNRNNILNSLKIYNIADFKVKAIPIKQKYEKFLKARTLQGEIKKCRKTINTRSYDRLYDERFDFHLLDDDYKKEAYFQNKKNIKRYRGYEQTYKSCRVIISKYYNHRALLRFAMDRVLSESFEIFDDNNIIEIDSIIKETEKISLEDQKEMSASLDMFYLDFDEYGSDPSGYISTLEDQSIKLNLREFMKK